MMSRRHVFWVAIYLALAVMGVFNLLPFYWMLSSSFKTEAEVASYPATLFPKLFTVGAYSKIWFQEKFVYYFVNSLIVSISTARCSSPRPETTNSSALAPSSTRRLTFVSNSR